MYLKITNWFYNIWGLFFYNACLLWEETLKWHLLENCKIMIHGPVQQIKWAMHLSTIMQLFILANLFFFFYRQRHFGKSQVYYWRLFLRLSTISNFSPMYIYKGNFGGRLEARHNKNIPVPWFLSGERHECSFMRLRHTEAYAFHAFFPNNRGECI